MTVSAAKRLKTLKDENAKLKKLLAEQMLDIAAIEGTAVKKTLTPAVKREAVAHLKAHLGLSERRAREIAGADCPRNGYKQRAQLGLASTSEPVQ